MSQRLPIRLLCLSLLSALSVFVACGSDSKDDGGGGGGDCQGLLLDGECVFPDSSGTGTDWHPDPDGDGITSATDLCPHTYDPLQADSDADGIGDFCDPDFVDVVENGPVVDLRAEHVTPYGAWLRHTSPRSATFGKYYIIAWSKTRADHETAAGVQAIAEENTIRVRLYEYYGERVKRPQIITNMDPDTTYFVSVRALEDTGDPEEQNGNIVELKTATAPELTAPGTHPRAWATAEQLQSMRDRHTSGDAAWAKWAQIVGDEALDSADVTEYYGFHACIGGALLFQATGEDRYRATTLSMISNMKDYWANNELRGNGLRWANAYLAICADLMWNELSASERNDIVAAYLTDDEAAEQNRIDDTDEFASITRTWIVDGLVACNAPGLDSQLSDRACALLEKGLRSFYGVQLVKARRNQGYFAQSGGGMPDGAGYGTGTASYWLNTLHALSNVGGQVDAYAPWVWNNLQSMQIQALTPSKKGLATHGDLDAYNNFDVEPNSLPLQYAGGSMLAQHMGFLDRAGFVEEAGHAKWHITNVFPAETFGASWALLMFDHDGLASKSDDEGLSTSFFDTGMGHFYDRTGWGADDSFFVFEAGWNGVDHSHQDAGNFQLYRKGVWLTSESLGYNGPASQAVGHNVPALSVTFGDDGEQMAQFVNHAEGLAKFLAASAQEGYAFVSADLRGPYSSGRYHSHNYDAVNRQILWLKPSSEDSDDRLVVYDLIDNSAGATPSERSWQMHLDTSHTASMPTLVGSTATYDSVSKVQVDVVVPANLVMSFVDPPGTPSKYPGEVYTGRLRADAQSSDASVRYVSILRASDAAISKPAVGVDDTDLVGVVSGTDLVLFQRKAGAEVNAMQSVEVSTSGVTTVWWTGLAPGEKFSLEATGSGVTLTPGGSLSVDEAGVLVGSI